MNKQCHNTHSARSGQIKQRLYATSRTTPQEEEELMLFLLLQKRNENNMPSIKYFSQITMDFSNAFLIFRQ